MLQRVRDHIPLEQGLRPCELRRRRRHDGVRDPIPLEQGLRLNSVKGTLAGSPSQRPYSIRTRIKTEVSAPRILSQRLSETIFH